MPRFPRTTSIVALCAVLTACAGTAPAHVTVTVPTSSSVPMSTTTIERTTSTTLSACGGPCALAAIARVVTGAKNAAGVKLQGKSDAGVTNRPLAAPAATSTMPCGGTDYPPCYVAQRESGNTYGAYNPNGCDGHACFGRWQFSGAWACRLGLPCDLSTATPAQQDNAARLLWNHGAGCSNWAACN